jgi:N6-adenosine-specific RNA methylase IME4
MVKKYNIIYADPPWKFETWSKKGLKRCAESHYKTMKFKDLEKLPINEISKDNSVCFMWVTFPKLEEGIKLLKSWGFEYKTCAFTWIKKNKKEDSLFWGMGRYTRSNSEICLLGTKGKILPRLKHNIHSVVISKIREHSRKPDEVRNRITDLFGDLPRIELFAREKIKGWDVWGNEVKSDVILNFKLKDKLT